MKFSELLDRILGELGSVLRQVDDEDVEKLVASILSSDQVFIAGMGRSGLMARPFAMRLMQMGFPAYIVGDATTDRKSTRLNSSHIPLSRMPSSA